MGCLIWLGGFGLILLELWILLELTSILPPLSVFLWCGSAALAGIWFLRTEDFSLWTLLESEIQNQRAPTEELLDAILLLVSGVLLLIPGILSDAVAITLLFPGGRHWAVMHIKNFIQRIWLPPTPPESS